MILSERVLNPRVASAMNKFIVSHGEGRFLLSSPQVTAALTVNLETTEKVFPDLRTGGYVQPDRWVPSENLRKYLLFAGNENVEQLHDYVFDEIDALGREFHYNGIFGISETGLNTSNIKRSINVVSRAMEGMRRRTGEESIAHILRSTKRGIDMIRDIMSKNDRGEILFPFTSKVVEALLVGIALHDLSEDEKEVIMGNGSKVKVRIGDVRPYHDLSTGETGLYTISYKIDKPYEGIISQLPDYELKLPMDYKTANSILVALSAVNASDVKEELMVSHLFTAIRNGVKPDLNMSIDEVAMLSLGVLIKIIDRLDNVATHPFMWDENANEFIHAPRAKVIGKANEILDQFFRLENILGQMLNDARVREVYKLVTRAQKLPRWLQDTITLSYMPSHWAIKILMGLSPNDIYDIGHLEKENKKGLPLLI